MFHTMGVMLTGWVVRYALSPLSRTEFSDGLRCTGNDRADHYGGPASISHGATHFRQCHRRSFRDEGGIYIHHAFLP